ncbi:NO signaling/Golgi transport ligand-binding domain [Pseudocohnilembus persalinus]|uniref:Trafficking protein particle complex subunit n=1 Tax=Pseudocohnilembus persalinus TaxID=266149 RepID=A0A0V0QPL8_PSEPJ|nr:NO signaling/Golgi transport ligand-binding domain [Pseudocohnilembus persalinus]|eukprot:KRX04217.1 NO signaling/Golgi transport ligand-binding domain [Pseudocohnilembus persalinus]
MKKAGTGIKSDKINTELLSLTYGAIVSQIIQDSSDIKEANDQLEQMGYNIGRRIIDEYLAKENKICRDYQQMAETIAKNAFDMFLGVKGQVDQFKIEDNGKNISFNIILQDNPLVDFVELTENNQNLEYCNIICGILRGSLATLMVIAKVFYIKDVLKGDDKSIIRVEGKREIIKDED